MSIEWSVPISAVPTVGEVVAAVTPFLASLGSTAPVPYFQKLIEGTPIGPPIVVAPDAPADGIWFRGDGDALAGIIVTNVEGLPDEPEGGMWSTVAAGRAPGSRLLAAILAGAIASSAGSASIYDEANLLGLGRRVSVLQLKALLTRTSGWGLMLAEAALLH